MALGQIADKVYSREADEVAVLVKRALEEGIEPGMVLNEGLLAGMGRVGQDFKADVLFLPEVLASARAMHAGMEVLRPLLSASEGGALGTFVIGTVQGDLHDIGKNLVGMMLAGAGANVVDLGIDVPPETFAQAIEEHRPQVLGISALLTTTMGEMEKTIRFLEKAGLRDGVRIMVGGAPVTEEFAQRIGADAYGHDAAEAVNLAEEWLRPQ